MNWIDFIIIALLAFGLLQGFINGLIIEIAGLAALVLGIWGSIRLSWWTALRLEAWFDMHSFWIGPVSFALTFCAIVFGVYLIGRLLDTVMRSVSLGFIVKTLGGLFGVLKTALILSVLFLVLNTIEQKSHFLPSATISRSVLYKPISRMVPALFPMVKDGNLINSFNRHKKESQDVTI